eukprot:1166948-Rhodomonas_salina.2
MSGTDILYGANILLRSWYAMSGTETACGATRGYRSTHHARRGWEVPRYAIALRARYAMSGTDRRYAATRIMLNFPKYHSPTVLRACYAVSGTDRGYAASRVCCYAGCGTDVGHAAIRNNVSVDALRLLLEAASFVPDCVHVHTNTALWPYEHHNTKTAEHWYQSGPLHPTCYRSRPQRSTGAAPCRYTIVLPTPSTVLPTPYALSGPTLGSLLSYAPVLALVPFCPTHFLCAVRYYLTVSVHPCAVPGTILRPYSYALPTRCPVLPSSQY